MFRRFLGPVVTFVLVAGLSFVVTRRVRSQSETRKPFTAFQIERRYDAKGVEGYHEYKVEAVRSDGSSAWYAWRPGPNGRLYLMGVIYDVAKGTVTDVDGITESIGTLRMTEGELAFQKRIDQSCSSAMERSSMAGENVAKVHEVYGHSNRTLFGVNRLEGPRVGLFCSIEFVCLVHASREPRRQDR